jgi:hypothetical protein
MGAYGGIFLNGFFSSRGAEHPIELQKIRINGIIFRYEKSKDRNKDSRKEFLGAEEGRKPTVSPVNLSRMALEYLYTQRRCCAQRIYKYILFIVKLHILAWRLQ